MLAELEDVDQDTISDDKMRSPQSFEDGKLNDTRSANRECFRVGEQAVWLDREDADLMRKRIKDRELKLQAQIETAELCNARTLQRVTEKYQRVASMMNQQICLKRVQKRNEKNELKLQQKLKKRAAEAGKEVERPPEIRIKMPFVFVRASSKNKYKPEKYDEKQLYWKIQAPLNLYGDTDVLELMQMGEIKSENDIRDYLGDCFIEKREFFVETGDMIKEKKAKYMELFRKYREEKHQAMYDYKTMH